MGYNDQQRLPTTTLNQATTGPPPLVAKIPPPTKTPTTRPQSRRQHGDIDNIQATKVGDKLHLVKRDFVDFGDNRTETSYKRLTTTYNDIEDRSPTLTPADIADIKFEKLKIRVGVLMKAYWAEGFTVRGLAKQMKGDMLHFSISNIAKYFAIFNANHYRQNQ